MGVTEEGNNATTGGTNNSIFASANTPDNTTGNDATANNVTVNSANTNGSATASGNTNGSGGTGAAPSVASVAAPIVDQAKQQAQKVVEHTQRRAGEAIDQARVRTKGWIETQLDQAADGLDGVANAVQETGEQLRSHDPNNMGQIADVAGSTAATIHNVSSRLRDATVDDIIRDSEDFARRQPGLFIGGVFVLGFMLARFLKSTGGSASATSYAPSTDRLLPVPIDTQSRSGV
jgi:cell division septum initiation protein DivIVA